MRSRTLEKDRALRERRKAEPIRRPAGALTDNDMSACTPMTYHDARLGLDFGRDYRITAPTSGPSRELLDLIEKWERDRVMVRLTFHEKASV